MYKAPAEMLEGMRWVVMRYDRRKRPAPDDGAMLYGWEMAGRLAAGVFVPMKQTILRGKPTDVPAIAGLMFVADTPAVTDRLAANPDNGIDYLFLKGRPYREPVVIPAAEMANFIAAVTSSDAPRYYAPEEITELHVGKQVTIPMSHPLAGHKGGRVGASPVGSASSASIDSYLTDSTAGITGRIVSIRGSRKRRLLVEIPGLLAATIEIDLSAHSSPTPSTSLLISD